MPESLRELLGGRLARLPAETVDVLLQVAALARPTIDVVAGGARRPRPRPRRARGRRPGRRRHPRRARRSASRTRLLASICYEQAPVWKRRAVHQALAGAVSDIEERARHRALAADGPDTAVAAELDDAAERAAARGATASAAELYELAAGLTPDDPALARSRRLRAATSYRLSGDGEGGGAARAAPHRGAVGCRAGRLLFELGTTFRADVSLRVALFDEALTEADGDDAPLGTDPGQPQPPASARGRRSGRRSPMLGRRSNGPSASVIRP